jgi:glutathione S-transferase
MLPAMKLYYTTTSAFVRKVMLVAHETHLADRIETITLRPSPTASDATLSRANPLSKIPALLLDDGTALYDSPVICEYLDTLHGGRRLLPPAEAPRWANLKRQALCDGIIEAGILVYYERTQRPKELHWEAWIRGQTQKAQQGLDELERDVAHFEPEVDLGQICAAATLGWLEFRAPIGDIRAGRPQLFRWYDRFRERPSMKATEPRT